MKYTYYNKTTGEITGNLVGIIEEAETNCPDDRNWIKGEFFIEDGYVVDGEFTMYTSEQKLKKGNRPGVMFRWNNTTMDWVGEFTSAERYSSAVSADVVYCGHVVQGDQASLIALRAALTDMDLTGLTTIKWKLKDNTFVDFSTDDLRAIVRTIAIRNQEAFLAK